MARRLVTSTPISEALESVSKQRERKETHKLRITTPTTPSSTSFLCNPTTTTARATISTTASRTPHPPRRGSNLLRPRSPVPHHPVRVVINREESGGPRWHAGVVCIRTRINKFSGIGMNEPQVQVRSGAPTKEGGKKNSNNKGMGERIVISAKPSGRDEWAENQPFIK